MRSKELEELRLDDSATKDFFISAFKEKNLVPIIGSGFTAGSSAQGRQYVQSGIDLKKYMKEQIVKANKNITMDELEKEDFDWIAELFEGEYDDIKGQGIGDYFLNHFTGVKLNNQIKVDFLNRINWDYVYTLNIDTAIEDSNRDGWEVYYPNKEFNDQMDIEGKKKLYKIHGDARRFVKYSDYNEMILTQSQYIASYGTNKMFHDKLSSDCGNKNLLYIGCSLDDEIDILYSVLSDKSKNLSDIETMRIYVTEKPLSEIKKKKLSGYNISHFILLDSREDYDYFYEYLISCYEKSLESQPNDIEGFRYKKPEVLDKDFNKNIQYLADINKECSYLPYYYIKSEIVDLMKLSTEKVNVITGRRFSGKTMLAHNILEHYRTRERYYINDQESILPHAIQMLMGLKNAIIVFDGDSIDENDFLTILELFDASNGNIVCIMINTYDDVADVASHNEDAICYPLTKEALKGRMSKADIEHINGKLDEIGISRFNDNDNILDNTLRIANVHNQKTVQNYKISSEEELIVIIWLLVQKKMYYEEIVSLGISKKYHEIVKRFAPFMQMETCKPNEAKKHSHQKIVCNGKLGLLQILNDYAYPKDTMAGRAVVNERHKAICKSIYRILRAYINNDNSNITKANQYVKRFIMFDTLNDVFSSKFSPEGIDYVQSSGENGRKLSGAANLIKSIYSDDDIKHLKGSDPNYWLQRAKSIYYISTSKNDMQDIYEGIECGKKAEQDSLILVQKGESRYKRTMSNSTIQVAMLYGRVANLNKYKNPADVHNAIEYYYKGLSDENNAAAADTLTKHSKGTNDFKNLVNYIMTNGSIIDKEWQHEANFLLNIGINVNGIKLNKRGHKRKGIE